MKDDSPNLNEDSFRQTESDLALVSNTYRHTYRHTNIPKHLYT